MNERLRASIDKYREIIEHAQQLEQLLSTGSSEALRTYTERLQQLQHDAGLHDQQLLSEIASDQARWQAHPLFQERMQLLEQIVKMNDLLLPKIHGMMAVTGSELAQLKEGRTALSGYHPNAGRLKKSIRGVG